MVSQHFAHVDTWVFDLDNTLYPPSADLFGQMDVRFSAYVQRLTGLARARAQALCHEYWGAYGSTLTGLGRIPCQAGLGRTRADDAV